MRHKLPNQNVKEMLRERGIQHVQVALDLDMHPSRLNLILNGWLRPTNEVQEMLATYLDVDASELWSE